jgi:hypothetical protein
VAYAFKIYLQNQQFVSMLGLSLLNLVAHMERCKRIKSSRGGNVESGKSIDL